MSQATSEAPKERGARDWEWKEKDHGEALASSEAQAREEGPEGESADGDESGDDEREEDWMGKPMTGASGARTSTGSKQKEPGIETMNGSQADPRTRNSVPVVKTI